MNWYKKIASVRDVKSQYLQRVIQLLKEAEEVANVDKIQAEQKLNQIFQELSGNAGDVGKIPTSVKETMESELRDAYSVLRDSPQNFMSIVDGVIVYLDDVMQSLYFDEVV